MKIFSWHWVINYLKHTYRIKHDVFFFRIPFSASSIFGINVGIFHLPSPPIQYFEVMCLTIICSSAFNICYIQIQVTMFLIFSSNIRRTLELLKSKLLMYIFLFVHPFIIVCPELCLRGAIMKIKNSNFYNISKHTFKQNLTQST